MTQRYDRVGSVGIVGVRWIARGIALSACLGIAAATALAADGAAGRSVVSEDPFLGLEDVESQASLDWVNAHNAQSLGELQADSRYGELRREIREVLGAKDRIAAPDLRGGWIYNFWSDAEHPRGLWRRTRPEDYAGDAPNWELLLDVGALGRAEGKSWVFKGAHCAAPENDRCLVSLSRGGGDAVEVREFDVSRRTFVPTSENGFFLPEAKSDVAWLDRDRVLVGTDFGPGSVTRSGYPRIVKLWRRGTALREATTVFEGAESDVSAVGQVFHTPAGTYAFVGHSPSFFEQELSLLAADGRLLRVPMPTRASIPGVFDSRVLIHLRADWEAGGHRFASGSLVALPIEKLGTPDALKSIELLYAPADRESLEGVSVARDAVYATLLTNVRGRVLRLARDAGAGAGGAWSAVPVALPSDGTVSVTAIDAFDDRVYAGYETFLEPSTLYAWKGNSDALPRPIKRLPARFDASGLETRQLSARSADGTDVPYFIVHRRGMKLDGRNPTLLYGYGGFEVPMLPSYQSVAGRAWLERGGVYVLANIRGGGEFGPAWHEAALKTHRQRAYDDFIAVAESLIATGVTSPRHLGIQGGSNGGLLVGAVFVERPELFNAVLCQVPLLDMRRFHKLLAGNSWIGEYGDPDDPAMWDAISRYSPYQNVRQEKSYPRVFFMTSTRDDRVHPGHARKMAARMESQGHDVLFFENVEGGHGAAADLEQSVRRQALGYTYLWRQLGAN